MFATARAHERVALGLGVFPAFGLSVTWPEDWLGREHTIKASIQTVNFNPTVAVSLLPELSLGAGLQVVRGAVELSNALPAVVGGTATLGGGTWGVGANVGLLYRPLPERLHLAFTYRSRAKLLLRRAGRLRSPPRLRPAACPIRAAAPTSPCPTSSAWGSCGGRSRRSP